MSPSPSPERIRKANLETLSARGFLVAPTLPLRELCTTSRQPGEVFLRQITIITLFALLTAPPNRVNQDVLNANLNGVLRPFIFPDELAMLGRELEEAEFHDFANLLQWRLEGAYAMHWALGATPSLSAFGEPLEQDEFKLLVDMAQQPAPKLIAIAERSTLRAVDELSATLDLFYCAHNAATSAVVEWLENGKKAKALYATVPAGFDAPYGRGVIQERRQALEWIAAPSITWPEVPLDT